MPEKPIMEGDQVIKKIKQYKNLILVVGIALLLAVLIAADPLGFCAKRSHDRAAIQNRIAIEEAEAEKKIAIIKAQTDYELKRIGQGLPVSENIQEESAAEGETDE